MTLTFAKRSRRRARGFTLIEAMVALSIALMACTALSLSLASSLQTTDAILEQTLARGLAEQLLDEALAKPYTADDPFDTSLGPSTYEKAGEGRERFDEIGDYNGYRATPPCDAWGVALGRDDGAGEERNERFVSPSNFFNRWEQQVDVYYVDEDDPATNLPANQTSNLRAIEVRIFTTDADGGRRQLAQVRRVVAYLPQL